MLSTPSARKGRPVHTPPLQAKESKASSDPFSQKLEARSLTARSSRKTDPSAPPSKASPTADKPAKPGTPPKDAYGPLAREIERYLAEAEGKAATTPQEKTAPTSKADKTPDFEEVMEAMDDLGVTHGKKPFNPFNESFLKSVLNNPKASKRQKAAARFFLKHMDYFGRKGTGRSVMTAHGYRQARKAMVEVMIRQLLVGQSLV